MLSNQSKKGAPKCEKAALTELFITINKQTLSEAFQINLA